MSIGPSGSDDLNHAAWNGSAPDGLGRTGNHGSENGAEEEETRSSKALGRGTFIAKEISSTGDVEARSETMAANQSNGSEEVRS